MGVSPTYRADYTRGPGPICTRACRTRRKVHVDIGPRTQSTLHRCLRPKHVKEHLSYIDGARAHQARKRTCRKLTARKRTRRTNAPSAQAHLSMYMMKACKHAEHDLQTIGVHCSHVGLLCWLLRMLLYWVHMLCWRRHGLLGLLRPMLGLSAFYAL